ncbi:MAG: phosphoenolpyruvate--protein phosphotransferase [Candidatus Aureabacteria bacterium]|nr:phosphoenolpyruvate--protein phosphotransferase [Candidatus Auribacterota bacterium]
MIPTETIERPDFHLKLVQEISDLVNQARGLDTILDGVTSKIAHSLHYDVVSIYLWEEKQQELVLHSNRGLKLNDKNSIRLKPSEGLTGLVFQNRRPLITSPASTHPRYKYFPEIGEEEFESYIGVPIILQNRCFGVLIGQTKIIRPITPADETLFQIIASRLAGLLEIKDYLSRVKPENFREGGTQAFQGKGISAGFVVGPIAIFKNIFGESLVKKHKAGTPDEEESRIQRAFEKVEKDLQGLIQTLEKESLLSPEKIDIFKAHLLILKDPTFLNPIIKTIHAKKTTAEFSLKEHIQAIQLHFKTHKGHFQDQGLDFLDLGERIIEALLELRGELVVPTLQEGAIVVAHDIGPSFLPHFHKHKIGGLVTETGGETSHTAILAQSLGIPAVSGIDHISTLLQSGTQLLVDGKTGFVFSNPDPSLIREYQNAYKKKIELRKRIEKEGMESHSYCISTKLTANIGFPGDVEIAKRYELNEAGLFRTEFAFMQFDKWPSSVAQENIYEGIAKSLKGRITVRTLDIGADKLLPYLHFPKEENPLLGLRSIRFSMEYLDLFRDQIRAILMTVRKGYSLRIILPMVTYTWEIETAREILEQIARELNISSPYIPQLGIMVEVPIILYQPDDYANLVDFFSIGTNDLIQYLLAVDRNSNTIGHLYSGFHPAVLRALHDFHVKTRSLGKEVSICGELAGTPKGALALTAIGYRQFSILPSRTPFFRYLCRKVTHEILDSARQVILTEKKESEIQRYLTETLVKLDPVLLEME